MVQLLWKPVWRFLNRMNIELPCDPVILFFGVCSELGKKKGVKSKMCTPAHNSQKVETTQMLISGCMDEQNMEYTCDTYNGIHVTVYICLFLMVILIDLLIKLKFAQLMQ